MLDLVEPSACPNACGLIATILEFNRNWTVDDIKTWLGTLQNQNTTTDFYDIAEETTANGNGHADPNGLQGATARVIQPRWDIRTSQQKK